MFLFVHAFCLLIWLHFPLRGMAISATLAANQCQKTVQSSQKYKQRSNQIWRRPLPASNKAYHLSAATSIRLYRFLIPACFRQHHYYPVWSAKHSQSCPWFATKWYPSVLEDGHDSSLKPLIAFPIHVRHGLTLHIFQLSVSLPYVSSWSPT